MEFILSIIVIIIFLTMMEAKKHIYKRYYQVMVRHGPPWTSLLKVYIIVACFFIRGGIIFCCKTQYLYYESMLIPRPSGLSNRPSDLIYLPSFFILFGEFYWWKVNSQFLRLVL